MKAKTKHSVRKRPVKSLMKALRILDTLGEHPSGLGITDLSDMMKAPKSTVHRLIATLEAAGYAVFDPPTSKYVLGSRVAKLGEGLSAQSPLLAFGVQTLEMLTQECRETSHLAMMEGTEVVYISREESKECESASARGTALPLTARLLAKCCWPASRITRSPRFIAARSWKSLRRGRKIPCRMSLSIAALLASASDPVNGETDSTVENAVNRVPVLGIAPSGLNQAAWIGTSNYNSLQANLQKRLSHGLQSGVAYTYSKVLTDVTGVGSFPLGGGAYNDQINPEKGYGPADFDTPTVSSPTIFGIFLASTTTKVWRARFSAVGACRESLLCNPDPRSPSPILRGQHLRTRRSRRHRRYPLPRIHRYKHRD